MGGAAGFAGFCVVLVGFCKQLASWLQHTTSEVAHKAAFEEKRTWVDPQLRP